MQALSPNVPFYLHGNTYSQGPSLTFFFFYNGQRSSFEIYWYFHLEVKLKLWRFFFCSFSFSFLDYDSVLGILTCGICLLHLVVGGLQV